MEAALISAAVVIVLAIIGSSWLLGTRIQRVDTKVESICQRFDRVEPERLREHVSVLEATAGIVPEPAALRAAQEP